VALKDCEVVYHLVGITVLQSSNSDPRYDVESKLAPSLSLLDLCKEYRIKQTVFASSGGTVYGIPRYVPIDEHHETMPICSYGIHKLAVSTT
jgi:UDP-glucose 4-epimerase